VTVVVDASAVAAAFLDRGPDGTWARGQLAGSSLAAPTHMLVEVSNVFRRAVLSGIVGRDVAALAHVDLVQLSVTVFPFEPLAPRVWELHPSVTAYDAGYVALAEALDVPFVTLDRRLSRASGPTCEFLLPS
jgi:predicted nucleic acid-binding protein